MAQPRVDCSAHPARLGAGRSPAAITALDKANFRPFPSCSQSPTLPRTSATSTLQPLQKAHPEVPAPSCPIPEALTLAHPHYAGASARLLRGTEAHEVPATKGGTLKTHTSHREVGARFCSFPALPCGPMMPMA